jgi:hypothetical protein
MRLLGLVIVIELVAWTPLVRGHAQDTGHNSRDAVSTTNVAATETVEALEAKKLFLEGRAALDRGETKSGCEQVERSHRLLPTLATLLNLGLCQAANGRLATAHDYYRQAEVLATQLNDTERRDFAHDEAAALAFRRATLTLRVSDGPDSLVTVKLDDAPRPREVWEQPMFVDAGDHSVEVESAGRQTWHGSVHVVDGSKNVVVIPELNPEAKGSEAPIKSPSADAPAARELPSPTRADVDSEPSRGLSTGRIVALSVAGAGVVAVGASVAYAFAASSAYDESKQLCGPNHRCIGRGAPLRDEAHADATRATIFGIAGAAAIAGGAVLWFLSPQGTTGDERMPVSAAIGPGGVSAQWSSSF